MTPINIRTALIVCAVAFVITAAIGPAVIRYLRKMKFGQKILEIGPKWHMNKQNIPTMGGFMFIIGIAVAFWRATRCWEGFRSPRWRCWALPQRTARSVWWMITLRFAKRKIAGLTPKQKLVLQILVAGAFILVLFLESDGRARPLDPVYRCGDPASLAAVHHLCRVRYRGRG